LIEIYPVRAALEEVAARAAAVRLDGQVRQLQDEFDAMRHAAEAGDLHQQVQHDAEFHRLIVEASGNRILLEVWMLLRIEARTLITALKADMDPLEIVEMHRPVLEALAERDPEKAGRALRRHAETFGERLARSHE
jgi:DNA-binding GntR family transcriptional regulator